MCVLVFAGVVSFLGGIALGEMGCNFVGPVFMAVGAISVWAGQIAYYEEQ
jgi:hypothetical protein